MQIRHCKSLIFALVLLSACVGGAQTRPASASAPPAASVRIPRLNSGPTLEDFLAMQPSSEWEGKLAKVDDFRQWRPQDGAPSTQKTVAYLGYDAKMYDGSMTEWKSKDAPVEK
jgi:hypothetical protein